MEIGIFSLQPENSNKYNGHIHYFGNVHKKGGLFLYI